MKGKEKKKKKNSYSHITKEQLRESLIFVPIEPRT